MNKSYEKHPVGTVIGYARNSGEMEAEGQVQPEINRLEDAIDIEVKRLKEKRSIIKDLAARIDYFREDEPGACSESFSTDTHSGRLNTILRDLRDENYEFQKIIEHLRKLV
jgi:hypothetical protein